MNYLSTDEAYDYATLACWYQNSIDETHPPIWTDEHLEELLKDFYVIPKSTLLVDATEKAETAKEVFWKIARSLPCDRDFNNKEIELGYSWALAEVRRAIAEIKKEYKICE